MGKQRELAAHVKGALNNGLTELELRQVISIQVSRGPYSITI